VHCRNQITQESIKQNPLYFFRYSILQYLVNLSYMYINPWWWSHEGSKHVGLINKILSYRIFKNNSAFYWTQCFVIWLLIWHVSYIPPPPYGSTAPRGPRPPEASQSHSETPHSVGLLCTSDQPVAETSTWQHKTLTRDRYPCLPVGFEPAIPASERPQTHALDHAATEIG
jgi:hypothetical protein